jgi:signal transduction histidine kinase
VENNLLRISQEALTNAVRHAAARNIQVRLRFKPTVVRLEVSDDGRGFDPAAETAPRENGRFGLPGMRERADAIHARLDIQSDGESGTRIEFEVSTE